MPLKKPTAKQIAARITSNVWSFKWGRRAIERAWHNCSWNEWVKRNKKEK